MRPEIELLRGYLAQTGQKVTRQRLLVAERFLEAEGHLSAEELYHLMLDEGTKVGLATVYRSLKTLVAAGLAQERRFPDGAARYEAVFGEPLHDHLVCTECGAIIEMGNPCVDRIYATALAEHGFQATSHRLVITGRCRDCSQH